MEDLILQNCYFWLSLCGLIIGCLHFSVRSCERSNCRSFKCCDVAVFERTVKDTGDPIIQRENSDSLP